ncbi:MAG: FAD-dependent oxidoreductase, partial [Burkholderiales bacterium]
PHTSDGRVLFAVPWLGKTVLGTTDTPTASMAIEPKPLREEIDFLLGESARDLTRAPVRADVRSVWVGLRPLVAPARQAEGATKTLSREHTIVTGPNGLVTVTGGKWTTYRAMAEDVLERCFDERLLPRKPGGLTEHHALLGAGSGQPISLHVAPGLHLYGTEAQRVTACPGAETELGMGLTEAMVRFAVREEFAQTVEDVLARRWRSLFLDAAAAAAMAPSVASILLDEGCANPELDAFLSLCRRSKLSSAVGCAS